MPWLLILIFLTGCRPYERPSRRLIETGGVVSSVARVNNSTLLAAPQTNDSVLTTSSGERLVGRLNEIGASGLLFQQEGQIDSESFSFDQVATLHFNPQTIADPGVVGNNRAPHRIQLIDQSIFLASSFRIQDATAFLELVNGMTIQIDARNLANVQLTHPANGIQSKQWEAIEKSTLSSGDALVIRRNERYETLEGVIGDISFETIHFRMGDRSADINRDKIDGMLFFHASGRRLQEPICRVVLNDRSSLMVKLMKSEGPALLCTAVSGSEWLIPLSKISVLDFSLGRTVRLGDLSPTSSDWAPWIANSRILDKLRALKLPRSNRSYDNRPLELQVGSAAGTIRIRSFESGYAMVGGTKLAFSLGGNYDRLTGLVGFSPRSGAGGDVILMVKGDNKLLLKSRLQKSVFTAAVPIDVKIKGVDRLVIEVDYGDGRAIGDIIHLCDLTVTR